MVIQWFYTLCGDWGLSIIIITIIFRILIYPITKKQFKSTYKMQKLQPQIQAINQKYADDPQRKQEEMMRVYQEAKFNPLSGCLPMLLQMPIFVALFTVLRNLSAWDGGAPESYTFYNLIPDITKSASDMFASPEGFLSAIPYILLLLLFGASMVIPMLLQNQGDNKNQMRIMMVIMCGFMLFIGWGTSAGVLLYWDVSSLIGVGQQQASKYLLKKKDEREGEAILELEPVKVEIDRKERKARPRKKG
jgi:YidC/Oxa1 family membrane protein insertase